MASTSLLQQLGDRKEKDGEAVMRPASFRPSSAVRREDEDVTGKIKRRMEWR